MSKGRGIRFPKRLQCGVYSRLALCSLFILLVFPLFSRWAPEPYMDEIFHVPQAQVYCGGDWSYWDPKITTLPGQHLLGVLSARTVTYPYYMLYGPVRNTTTNRISRGSISSSGGGNGNGSDIVSLDPLSTHRGVTPAHEHGAQLCSVAALRFMNVILTILGIYITYALVRELHPALSSSVQGWKTVYIVLLPTHWFFAYLFYSDVGATLSVLLLYLYGLRRVNPVFITVLSLTAVVFRQTNIVWVGFVFASVCIRDVQDELRREGVPTNLFNTVKRGLSRAPHLLAENCGYTLVLLGFALFVYSNQGIVVGDRSNHQAMFHLPQVLYFAVFLMVFSLPDILNTIVFPPARHPDRLLRWNWRHPSFKYSILFVLILSSVCFLAVSRYTFVHPFILSDNRHYTFYLWRHFFARYPSIQPYLYIPLYVIALVLLYSLLDGQQSTTWTLLYSLCTCAVLIPTGLIEPRYYTTPLVMFTLHVSPVPFWGSGGIEASERRYGVGVVVEAVVNILVVYIYLARPFTWNDGSLARFMY